MRTLTKENIDLLVVKFIYGSNLPFSIVDQPSFRALLEALRPNYTPPERRRLAGSLLDTVHRELHESVRECLNGSISSLIEDGWSNVRNEPVLATCIQFNGRIYFLRAVDTGASEKNAEYCAQVARDSIRMAEEEFGTRIGALVTDNAYVMESARNLLHETHPNVLVYGCSAHIASLLAADISPHVIIENIKIVQKYFKNHHQPGGLLRECSGALKPVIPCATRWGTQLQTVENFLHNHVHYISIVQNHSDLIDPNVQRKIKDWNLFTQVYKSLFL